MKIGSIQSFKANFTHESEDYLNIVKQEAIDSRRYAEYQSARNAIMFNFPNGKITKLKSYPDVDTFVLTPNNPIQFTIRKNPRKNDAASALDTYIKLAREIRRISI